MQYDKRNITDETKINTASCLRPSSVMGRQDGQYFWFRFPKAQERPQFKENVSGYRFTLIFFNFPDRNAEFELPAYYRGKSTCRWAQLDDGELVLPTLRQKRQVLSNLQQIRNIRSRI